MNEMIILLYVVFFAIRICPAFPPDCAGSRATTCLRGATATVLHYRHTEIQAGNIHAGIFQETLMNALPA
jgi:hypothetical protein